jgi:hypothetical protein
VTPGCGSSKQCFAIRREVSSPCIAGANFTSCLGLPCLSYRRLLGTCMTSLSSRDRLQYAYPIWTTSIGSTPGQNGHGEGRPRNLSNWITFLHSGGYRAEMFSVLRAQCCPGHEATVKDSAWTRRPLKISCHFSLRYLYRCCRAGLRVQSQWSTETAAASKTRVVSSVTNRTLPKLPISQILLSGKARYISRCQRVLRSSLVYGARLTDDSFNGDQLVTDRMFELRHIHPRLPISSKSWRLTSVES